MAKKDKKEEKKLAKKAAKAAEKLAKKAKKGKRDKIAEKAAAEMAEELRAQREAALDVEEPLAEDAVAVVGQTEAEVAEEAAASIAYAPVEGEKLKVISLKMPESLIAATDEAAAAYGEGVTRSEFIRIAIEKMVNEK